MPKIEKRESNRLTLFRILRRNPHGLTASKLRERLGFSKTNGQLGILLRGEIAVKRIKVEQMAESEEGKFETKRYLLTKKGVKAAEQGTVDSDAKRLGLVQLGRAWEANDPKPWTKMEVLEKAELA